MAYHLQTDAMAKMPNRTMEQLQQIHAMTDGWVATQPLIAMIINAMPQSRTGMVPHKVTHRHKLRLPLDLVTTLIQNPLPRNMLL